MDTPIADFVRAYAASGTVRFHMPGHKGRGPLGCEALDITEIAGADSLYEAYEDNYPYFKAYLDRSRPIFPEQYFQLHYIKQFIKRLIGRS